MLWLYGGAGTAPAIAAAACPDGRRLSVMISNVLLTKPQSEGLLAEVRAERPDLFLAMEVDGWWDRALEPVAADMPHGARRITGPSYGMRLFSRPPLTGVEVRFLADRARP